MGLAGTLLETYKNYYYAQPKSFKVLVVPFLIAITIAYIQVFQLSNFFLFTPAVLIFWGSYNQYPDSLLQGKLSDEKRKTDQYRNFAARLFHIINMVNELVSKKSDIFNLTTEEAEKKDNKHAKQLIEELGSYKRSLDRIVGMVYKVFEKYADTVNNQKYRTSFLTPDGNGKYLEIKSWYNSDQALPLSNSEQFDKGGSTLAGHLWGYDGYTHKLVDNTETYVREHPSDATFRFTKGGQNDYLRSIICYKVVDQLKNEFIGVLCVDTNVSGTLGEYEDIFVKALEVFSKRIVFETRCNFMKKILTNSGN